MSSSPSSGMCNLGNCIGYFDCLAQCGTCAANCPYGCCCVTPQNAPSNCGICPTGSQCMSVSDCQSKGGTCAANCPMGCCCSLGGTAQQPQAPPQTTQPQTTLGSNSDRRRAYKHAGHNVLGLDDDGVRNDGAAIVCVSLALVSAF